MTAPRLSSGRFWDHERGSDSLGKSSKKHHRRFLFACICVDKSLFLLVDIKHTQRAAPVLTLYPRGEHILWFQLCIASGTVSGMLFPPGGIEPWGVRASNRAT